MNTAINVNHDSFDFAVAKSNVPVLVDFWGPMCGPCKMIAPILDEIAAEGGDAVRVAKVNVADNPALANRFGIRSTPTLLVFNKGELKQTFVGMTGKRALVGALDECI